MKRILLLLAIALAGCSGSTGSGLVTFSAHAAGSGARDFDVGSYHVTLTRASFHIGAVYLNMSRPTAGLPEQPCVLPGIFVGEVFGGVDVDLLSTAAVPFPSAGQGTANPALAAEVWLTRGDINAAIDPTPILDVAGTATRSGQSYPFRATVTISTNRQIPPPNVAEPGANPICRQRIVSPIPIDLTLTNGGTLAVTVDPSVMFSGIDFAGVPPGSDGVIVIPDEQGGVGGAFFSNVISTAPYSFAFTAP